MAPLIGRTIAGKFLLESLVGEGGMGAVYRARHLALEKTVAVKIMHAEHATVASFASRFEREARAASRLDHPNSVRVLDFGSEPDGLLYLTMEFLEGRDLYTIIEQDKHLPPERIVSLLSQTLGALAAAHEAGIVHRDLKPENIMVLSRISDDGAPLDVVKVCDFGIARLAELDEPANGRGRRITGRGIAIGTPEYMSPEQAMGEEIDARSDLYSVGVILFQLLTGKLPFEGPSPMGVAMKHVSDAPPDILSLSPGANPRLVAICERAMKKRPADRYQTARELRADIRGALGATEAAPRTTSFQSVAPGSMSRRGRTMAAGVILMGAGLMAYGVFRRPASGSAAASPPSVTSARLAVSAEPPTELVPTPATSAMANPSAPSIVDVGVAVPGPSGKPLWTRPTGRVAAETATSVEATPRLDVASAQAIPSAPPPAVPAVTPPPVAPPTPPPAETATPTPPPPPPLDLTTARVSVGAISTTNALPAASVRSAVARADFVGCYRAALKAAGVASGGTVTLHVQIDADGYITSARAGGASFLGSGAACLESRVRGLRVANVDTGDASADVTLVFAP